MLNKPAMRSLHRHSLAVLSGEGWSQVLCSAWEPSAFQCVAYWARHGLPLVVTSQSVLVEGNTDQYLSLGLAAPQRWKRQRLSLIVPRQAVLRFEEFPLIDGVASLLAPEALDSWRRLCCSLAEHGLVARVYGSYGWQELSGLEHVREGSDLDIWVQVANPAQADLAASLLQGFHHEAVPRLDGELVFGDGRAVAWREWIAWREGRHSSMLMKSIMGPSLVRTMMEGGTGT